MLAIAPLPPLPNLTNSPPWLGGFLVLLVVLVLLLVRKLWHGRPRGGGPVCRQCGYDLRGRPVDADRCAECGNDLTAPGSVLAGGRVSFFKSAMALLFVAVAIGYFAVLQTVEWSHSFNWMWMDSTQSVLVAVNGPRWQLAAHELARRARADSIGDADLPDVITLAFDQQHRTKSPDWALTLEGLRAHDRLPDDVWQAYAEHVVHLTLSWPKNVKPDEFQWIRVAAVEGSDHGEADFTGQWTLKSLNINGEPVEVDPLNGDFQRDAAGSAASMPIRTIRIRPQPAGPKEVEAVIDINYTATTHRSGLPGPGDTWRRTVGLRTSYLVTASDSP